MKPKIKGTPKNTKRNKTEQKTGFNGAVFMFYLLLLRVIIPQLELLQPKNSKLANIAP